MCTHPDPDLRPALALTRTPPITLDPKVTLTLTQTANSAPSSGIRSGGELFIIGDTTMRNYYLVFDYAQKRIGWGPVNRKAGGCGSIQEGEVAAEFALGRE